MAGQQVCKATALQPVPVGACNSLPCVIACVYAAAQELGLPCDPDVPLLGFIGRLDYQKGVDLIRDNFDWLMHEGAQLVLLGSGRDDLENSLRCATDYSTAKRSPRSSKSSSAHGLKYRPPTESKLRN